MSDPSRPAPHRTLYQLIARALELWPEYEQYIDSAKIQRIPLWRPGPGCDYKEMLTIEIKCNAATEPPGGKGK